MNLLTCEDQKVALRSANGDFFNSVLVNRYENEDVGIKWHCDSENCYGKGTITIGSVSLGAERVFELRRKPLRQKPRKQDQTRRTMRPIRMKLGHGSLLIMGGTTQESWQHSVPSSSRFKLKEQNQVAAAGDNGGDGGGQQENCNSEEEKTKTKSRINLTFRHVIYSKEEASRSKGGSTKTE
jgi:hypothetical protein